MSVVGLICAFNEAGRIGRAVTSLLEVGCDRVVVVDGAWIAADGHTFEGGEWWSTDGTREEAEQAGAEFVQLHRPAGDDGAKRNVAIHACGAMPGDHLFLLDADERAVGKLTDPPSGHGCVLLKNLKPNDLPGVRTDNLDPAHRETYPLLRWLRYDPDLCCDAPGRYRHGDNPIDVYLVPRLARASAEAGWPLLSQAYRALRDHEDVLEPGELSVLPILGGVEIEHVDEASPERVEAKRRYYDAQAAA